MVDVKVIYLRCLSTRASYDTDQTNYLYTTTGIAPAYNGNNMRKVVMPVNSGPNVTAAYPTPYTVMGFASFLLRTNYPTGGNDCWCAIYMGSDTSGGSGGVFGVAGAYVVRLTQ